MLHVRLYNEWWLWEYIHTCLPANLHDFIIFTFPDSHTSCISIFPNILEFHKYVNSTITEIQNQKIVKSCMFASRHVCMYKCMHIYMFCVCIYIFGRHYACMYVCMYCASVCLHVTMQASNDNDALSIVPFHLSSLDDWNEVPNDFVTHVMPLWYSSGQDDWNEVQHEFFSHLTILPLASVSCDANGIVNSTIALIRPR